jgi:hypothetical protein
MRDAPLVMAATHTSDLELFATQERNDNDPWSPAIQKVPSTQLNGGEMPQSGDVVTPSRHDKQLDTSSSNGENRCDIRFGLHPSELFESSQNFGAYREYEHHSNGHINRVFTVQLVPLGTRPCRTSSPRHSIAYVRARCNCTHTSTIKNTDPSSTPAAPPFSARSLRPTTTRRRRCASSSSAPSAAASRRRSRRLL